MSVIPSAVSEHPGLILLGLLALAIVAGWLARRLIRILGLIVLVVVVAAVLPGPRGAASAALQRGSLGEGLGCLRAAAAEPGIWRGSLAATEIAACQPAPARGGNGDGAPRKSAPAKASPTR